MATLVLTKAIEAEMEVAWKAKDFEKVKLFVSKAGLEVGFPKFGIGVDGSV